MSHEDTKSLRAAKTTPLCLRAFVVERICDRFMGERKGATPCQCWIVFATVSCRSNCTPRIRLVFHGEALGLVTSVGIHRRYRRWGMILCQDTRFPAQGESVLTDWSGKSPKSRKAVEFRRYLLVRLPPRMSHVGRRGVPSKPPRSSQLLFFSKSRTTSSAVIASSVMAGVKLLCFFALLQISNSSARASTSA